MIICGTGHRPNKLGGYGKPAFERLVSLSGDWLDSNRPDVVISGVALGWDQALAVAAIRRKIETHAYVPCEGHSNIWPEESRRYYEKILRKCAVVRIAPVAYSAKAMMDRNKDMVDAADLVLAIWDGSSGGTGNCVRYGEKQHKELVNLWDRFIVKND